MSEQTTEDGRTTMAKEEEEVVVVEAAGLATVPDDVMLGVFLHLPPISVLRFLFASKNWYNLIFNPYFLQKYASEFLSSQRNHLDKPLVVKQRPAGLLFCPNTNCTKHPVYAILPKDQNQNQDQDPPPPPPPPPVLKVFLDHSLLEFKQQFPDSIIVDSCNGLLLSCETSPIVGIPHKYNYYCKVFNPMIKQHKEVPIMDLLGTFDQPDQVYRTMYLRLVFDPSLLASFKVLVMLIAPPHNHFELHVYSDDTGLWKLLTSFPENTLHCEGVMFDGVFYWFRDDDSICFDVVNDTVSFLPLPTMSTEENTDLRNILYAGECGGRLRLIQEYRSSDQLLAYWLPFRFKILEMEKKLDQPPTWTLKSLVNIKAGYDHDLMQKVNPGSFRRDDIKVMHLYETEEGEEAVLLLSRDYERIVSFNITTETFGNKLTSPYFERYYGLDVFSFTPTLFPLHT